MPVVVRNLRLGLDAPEEELPGLASKVYWQMLSPGTPFPEVACPNPSCLGCLLRPHGWYRRYLDGDFVAIRRGLCERCRGVTLCCPRMCAPIRT